MSEIAWEGPLPRKWAKVISGHREVIEGKLCHSKEYNTWMCMLRRCYAPKFPDYGVYGGQGIRVCVSWVQSFEAFLNDMGPRPQTCTLNRINGSLLYSKDTCEWADKYTQSYDQKIQSNNTSGYRGVIWIGKLNRWRAQASFKGKRKYIGHYKTKEEAALAYNQFVGLHYGNRARLNILDEPAQVDRSSTNKFPTQDMAGLRMTIFEDKSSRGGLFK